MIGRRVVAHAMDGKRRTPHGPAWEKFDCLHHARVRRPSRAGAMLANIKETRVGSKPARVPLAREPFAVSPVT